MNDNVRIRIKETCDSIEDGSLMIFKFCEKASKDTQLLYELMYEQILKIYEHIEYLSVDDYIQYANGNPIITCGTSLDKKSVYNDYNIKINNLYEDNNQIGKYLKNTFCNTKSKEQRYGYYYLEDNTKLLIDTQLLSNLFQEDGFKAKITQKNEDELYVKISIEFTKFVNFIKDVTYRK